MAILDVSGNWLCLGEYFECTIEGKYEKGNYAVIYTADKIKEDIPFDRLRVSIPKK